MYVQDDACTCIVPYMYTFWLGHVHVHVQHVFVLYVSFHVITGWSGVRNPSHGVHQSGDALRLAVPREARTLQLPQGLPRR